MKHARLFFSCTPLSFQTNLIGACHFQNCRWCFIPKQSIYHWRVPKDHRRAAKGICCPTAGSGTSSKRRWVGNSNPAPRLVILQQVSVSVSVSVSLSDFMCIICLSATIREAATAMPPPEKPESEQWNLIKENERYLRSPKWDMKLHVYDDWGKKKKKIMQSFIFHCLLTARRVFRNSVLVQEDKQAVVGVTELVVLVE